MSYIKKFSTIGMADLPSVGGKNASLGEMFNTLSSKGIKVPGGFAVTAEAFKYFIAENNLATPVAAILSKLDRENFTNLKETGRQLREMVMKAQIPTDLQKSILNAYDELSGTEPRTVAVRSSATSEDLPEASFAGQHESYLDVLGYDDLLIAVQKCYASIYTDRAIKYREDKGFPHDKVFLSVGVQLMVRADKACSGVGFTLEPESGFRDVVHIAGVWGLGENIVQGTVTPDEFLVFKPSLRAGKKAIIQKKTGAKEKTMIYTTNPDGMGELSNIDTPAEMRKQLVLSDAEVTQLAGWAVLIEEHYQKPMDIEWGKDGITGELFILQARPETVHSLKKTTQLSEYTLLEKGKVITYGSAVGSKIVSGTARILGSPKEQDKVKPGDIVVTELTSPDWDPILKKAAAIITDKGGRTSHASIIARELGVPAIVGTGNATQTIREGQTITLDCSGAKKGIVYEGKLEWEERNIDLGKIEMPAHTEAMMIIADPEKAFSLSFYPNNGVGLLRMEFIINNTIQVHPMALVRFDELKDQEAKDRISELTQGYKDKKQFFIDKLSMGVGAIAAAFYPKDVIVRMSDFKSNEYADLIGGKELEPNEENPMIGFRGASRYYNPLYKEGFRLECEAMKVVRNEMGLSNVKLMIPFCRTVEEGKKVVELMREYGLEQGDNGLEIYVMAEIPSNVLQADEFAEVFDGFSIGSNDLTQLTLGIDRDSALVADLFSEQNESVKTLIAMVINKANAQHKKIGLCGQAPSDMPEFAQFLVEQGIGSISFNPDALLKGIENICKAEKVLA